ncbi:lipase 1-like [Leguminivora glycinivorella]|uniref:lipase 1-like n=1 Tax=Leguminivora glycinivorella TaxID=1035111 RepID=UPI0020102D7E|nr:lipase 1-like [Leguminivora glycinivorella]
MEIIILSVLYLLHVGFVSCGSGTTGYKLLNFAIPDARLLKKSLRFDEDIYLNFTELAHKYKYSTEEHHVATDDGYILTVFRILPKCRNITGYPIILLHGIFDSSDVFILAGPQNGLGYVLTDNCYDVWAANHRGNVYSRKHVALDPNKDSEYWNYSFDEHGVYDLPAVIDYVMNSTGLPKVNYIGHSQGTTDFFTMASLKPDYNAKIQLSVHLAPVVFWKNFGIPVLKFLAPSVNSLKDALDKAGLSEVLAKHQLAHVFMEYSCRFVPNEICGTGLYITTGYKSGTISSRTLSAAGGHLFSGTSTKSLAHLGQLITSQKFQRFDEGTSGNIQRYGTRLPPEYDLSKVTSPVLLMTAQNDYLSPLEDVKELASKLPNLVENVIIPNPTWSHNNHLWGKDVWKFELPKILEYIKYYNS